MTLPALIAGNWKMNGTPASAKQLAQAIAAGADGIRAELAVFPPVIHTSLVATCLQGSKVALGAQTLSAHAAGAHTGEISAAMLQAFGVEYVLVGHSERRTLLGESDVMVAAQCRAALKAGLKPILCIGESLDARKNGNTLSVLTQQLAAVFQQSNDFIDLLNKTPITVAYEPVWAIGTGEAATAAVAQETHAAIRAWMQDYDKAVAKQTRILYGGSLKPENAVELLAQSDIDGGLIGGAALEADAFLAIARACRM